jgi:methionine synthase II (cobalamin-independent)
MPATSTVEDLNLLRVDQVGSLVVPAELAAASDRRQRGEMSESELRETEDKAIRAVMRK